MWDYNRTNHLKVIQKLSDNLHQLIHDPNNDTYFQSKTSYGNTLSLMDKIPPLMKTLCQNNNWMRESQYSSLGKILFNNGYYDFQKEKFYSKEEYGFNPEIVFFGKIHHDFEAFDDADMEYMEDVKQRLFHNPLGKEVGDYIILNLARALAGDKMKRILFGLGDTNCGKSIITTAISVAFGDYFGSFNAENLAQRNSSNDEAQIMRWCLLLKYKRVIISNEIKSNIGLNGNAIKKISSGGDSIVARGHCPNEEEFITHFLPIVMANDIPKIKPYDSAVDSRAKVITYKRQFVDEPSNEFELLKDPNIEVEVRTLRFQRVFIGLMINAYMDKSKFEVEPNEVVIAKGDWISADKSVIDTVH